MLLLEDARGERLDGVVGQHANGLLQDDGPAVDLDAHEVGRAPRNAHAVGKGLFLGVHSGERGEQRRVDVDEAVEVVVDERLGHDAQVPGVHEQVGRVLVDDADGLRVELLAGERAGFEHLRGDTVLLGPLERVGVAPVREDEDEFRVEPARPRLVDEGLQVRAGAGDQDGDADGTDQVPTPRRPMGPAGENTSPGRTPFLSWPRSLRGGITAAQVISGTEIAAQMRVELAPRVAAVKAKLGRAPGLVAVLVGNNPASEVYVRAKAKACEENGLFHETLTLAESTTEAALLAKVRELNSDPRFHGILVQSPLPRQINPAHVYETISIAKDVDCFHPFNVGKLALGEETFAPCTPKGVVEMLVRSGHPPDGKHVVVVGRSNIVGKPLVNLLVQKQKGANATVTCCHTGTKDIGRYTREADIVVVAAGHPGALTADMVREGAVVIDVGVNRIADPSSPKGTRLVGDVDFEAVSKKVAAISPVPGGVGPMTITMLLFNTVRAAEILAGLAK